MTFSSPNRKASFQRKNSIERLLLMIRRLLRKRPRLRPKRESRGKVKLRNKRNKANKTKSKILKTYQISRVLITPPKRLKLRLNLKFKTQSSLDHLLMFKNDIKVMMC